MGEHEKTDVTEADRQLTNGAEVNAKPGEDEVGPVSGEAEEESGTRQPGADPEDAEQIAVEREERLDPANRPDGAEVNNSDRKFDAEKGLYTDSEGYDEAPKRFPAIGDQGA